MLDLSANQRYQCCPKVTSEVSNKDVETTKMWSIPMSCQLTAATYLLIDKCAACISHLRNQICVFLSELHDCIADIADLRRKGSDSTFTM